MRASIRSLSTAGCALAFVIVALGALASSGCPAPQAPAPVAHPVAPPPPPPVEVPPARSVLSSYLVATSAGAHARAWEMLTHRDQAALSRASYVNQQQADDRLRAQVRTHYQIASIKEAGPRADAIVTVTTGLGAEQVRFVLRRDPDRWRIDYRASWGSR